MKALDAALAYADLGWLVFPYSATKRPLTVRGRTDATIEETTIRAWWRRNPDALIGIATGAGSGFVALDVDVDVKTGLNGWDSLDNLGISAIPVTPCDHSPRGGSHLLFRHPGHGRYIKSSSSKLGPGLDIRGDGGSVILPPGPGRSWDPVLGPDTPLAAFPDWAVIAEPARPAIALQPVERNLSGYGEAALDDAVRKITDAPQGQQRSTLFAQACGIGQLVGGGSIPFALAETALVWAGQTMPTLDRSRPWHLADIERAVHDGLLRGMREPRRPRRVA